MWCGGRAQARSLDSWVIKRFELLGEGRGLQGVRGTPQCCELGAGQGTRVLSRTLACGR